MGSPAERQASQPDWVPQEHWTDPTQRNTEKIDVGNIVVESPPSPPLAWILQELSTDSSQPNINRNDARNPIEQTPAVNKAFPPELVLKGQSTDPIQPNIEPTHAVNPTVETPAVCQAFASDRIREDPAESVYRAH